jgi:MFS family permease
VALSIPALCVALFSPIAGLLTDRWGRRRLLIVTLPIYAAFGMAPLLLTRLSAIIATRIGVGLAEAVIMTVATTLLGDYFQGERRDRWIAIQTGAVAIGATVLIFTGGLLGELGWRGPFLLYAIALILLVVVFAFIYEPARVRAAAPAHQATAPANIGAQFPWAMMLLISGLTLCGSILFYAYLQLGAVLALAGVSSPALIGVAGAIGNLAVACGSIGFKFVSPLGTKRLLAFGFGLAALGLMAIASARGYSAIVAAAATAMLGGGPPPADADKLGHARATRFAARPRHGPVDRQLLPRSIRKSRAGQRPE